MKKIRIFAVLALACVIGSVFAAGWTFNTIDDYASAASQVTGTVAEASSEYLTDLGDWEAPVNTLAVEYVNSDDSGSGYGVKAMVTGSLIFTYKVSDSGSYADVNNLTAVAELEKYELFAGKINVSATLTASAVQVNKDAAAGTVKIIVPASALVINCTGAFADIDDYKEFKTAVGAQQFAIKAILSGTQI